MSRHSDHTSSLSCSILRLPCWSIHSKRRSRLPGQLSWFGHWKNEFEKKKGEKPPQSIAQWTSQRISNLVRSIRTQKSRSKKTARWGAMIHWTAIWRWRRSPVEENHKKEKRKTNSSLKLARYLCPDWWKNKREKILRGNFFGITRNADGENRKK